MQQRGDRSSAECREVMIEALSPFISRLPAVARDGFAVASSTIDASDNERARVSLWNAIAGREQASDPDVLAARIVILLLHPSGIAEDPQTSLEYFVHWYNALGLPPGG